MIQSYCSIESFRLLLPRKKNHDLVNRRLTNDRQVMVEPLAMGSRSWCKVSIRKKEALQTASYWMHHSLSHGTNLQVEDNKEPVLSLCLENWKHIKAFKCPTSEYILNGSRTTGTSVLSPSFRYKIHCRLSSKVTHRHRLIWNSRKEVKIYYGIEWTNQSSRMRYSDIWWNWPLNDQKYIFFESSRNLSRVIKLMWLILRWHFHLSASVVTGWIQR
jgi:hypothetical protein